MFRNDFFLQFRALCGTKNLPARTQNKHPQTSQNSSQSSSNNYYSRNKKAGKERNRTLPRAFMPATDKATTRIFYNTLTFIHK